MKFRAFGLGLVSLALAGTACGGSESGGADSGSGGVGPGVGGSSSGGAGTAAGGANPQAGGSAAGGNAASGGSASDTGGTASGGQSASGGSGTGGAGTVSGSFEVEVHLASEDSPDAPTTVGIVTWSTSAGTPTEAHLEFGLTTDYGMEAPVDVTEPDLRTLLLGMKPDQTYHFRVVATVGGEVLTSGDFTVATGAAPAASLVNITKYDVIAADEREPGFIVTSYWQGTQAGMVFILDQDGDIVWWHKSGFTGGVAKAAISTDGRNMWMITANNNGEPVRRVSMDGLDAETYANAVGSHDIQAVEGDVMAFIEYGETDCDSIFEINPAGETKEVFESADFVSGQCHGNSLAYSKTKDAYSFSDISSDVYMFPRAGGTEQNTVKLTTSAGANSAWGAVQHGAHLLADNHLLIFANREGGAQGPSTAIEYNLDDGSEVWRYEGGQYSANLGDVQRLPGGNTLVTYSNAGIIHETTPEQKKVLEITGNKNLGYATWRPSLYGASPETLN